MLDAPKLGWSKIHIGAWSDRCSYLDDVPMKLLEAFFAVFDAMIRSLCGLMPKDMNTLLSLISVKPM